MSTPNDAGPVSSYSDPIYDRLEALSRWVRRMWLAVVLAIAAIIALFVILAFRARHTPESIGAVALAETQRIGDLKEREAKFQELGAQLEAPHFRVQALIEAGQLALLERDDATAARARFAEAATIADGLENADRLQLQVRLSQGAAEQQAKQFAKALEFYQRVERTGQLVRHPDLRILSALRSAECLAAQEPTDLKAAIDKLEPFLNSTELYADFLLNQVRALHARLLAQLNAVPTVPLKDKDKPEPAAMPAAPAPATPDASTPAAPAPAVPVMGPIPTPPAAAEPAAK